ncbi:MAG: efflux RND transporter periplasmic adaptor subunit [Candidatus Marinimicrobia bacterium]|mgnify:CR=1 FL=1|jgi:cobalt-zinc-cadmium efflux system membrane fusion protein|nr:efflux RND transporter periplasmic adaptor subunit [Candidatus Neomarinimicrobiota bacterium]|tara:strand:+ start:2640 stop:3608 length:969 start_codon:yes stop_codon:yes gene_type:complete
MKKQILIIIAATVVVTFLGTQYFFHHSHENKSHSAHHDGHTHKHDDEHHSELSFSPEILKETGIQIGIASEGFLEERIDLPGEIQISPDRLAHITPRFEGVVKEVFKQIGDDVLKDEVLAVIESNESLTDYELRSSMNGVVIAMHFTKGETARKQDHYFEVADLSEVWAILSVYQKYLAQLQIGQITNILLSSGTKSVSGKISYISPTLDKDTRTASARVILENTDSQFKPGQFITGQIVINKSNCKVLIPKTALETVNEHTVVFVYDGHIFEPSVLTLGKENQSHVEVLSGLNIGQQYVKENGFILKAQLGRDMFDGGHIH